MRSSTAIGSIATRKSRRIIASWPTANRVFNCSPFRRFAAGGKCPRSSPPGPGAHCSLLTFGLRDRRLRSQRRQTNHVRYRWSRPEPAARTLARDRKYGGDRGNPSVASVTILCAVGRRVVAVSYLWFAGCRRGCPAGGHLGELRAAFVGGVDAGLGGFAAAVSCRPRVFVGRTRAAGRAGLGRKPALVPLCFQDAQLALKRGGQLVASTVRPPPGAVTRPAAFFPRE